MKYIAKSLCLKNQKISSKNKRKSERKSGRERGRKGRKEEDLLEKKHKSKSVQKKALEASTSKDFLNSQKQEVANSIC